MSDLYHDSIGNELFGFVFSRSDEPIVISVRGMRSADQVHRIVSEPIGPQVIPSHVGDKVINVCANVCNKSFYKNAIMHEKNAMRKHGKT